MDIKIIIDKEQKEQIIIYAKEKTALIEEIEGIVINSNKEIIGYKNKVMCKLSPAHIYCFIIENGKVYAVTENDKLLLKHRLYELEEMLTDEYIKINKSCLANFKKIKHFDASISGNMTVTFKNGYTDYVSRRCVKKVKERLGL